MKRHKCKPILLLAIFLLTPSHLQAFKYGLGSCLDQRIEQEIWLAIEKKDLDGFIFLGDNIYGDHPNGKLIKMKKAYALQKNNLPKWLIANKEILAIWDDHDYGVNDGGKDFPLKKEAETIFLDFWNVPKNDPRWQRDGIYFKTSKDIDGAEVEIIGLDTRYFRSQLRGKKNSYKPNKNSNATVLGKDQWMWLESTIKNSTADIIIILSSIQILATNHPYEKWANFPLERAKLLNLISAASKNKTVLAISGDRHRSGIYQNKNFTEITSSSLNKTASRNQENDPLLVGDMYPEKNFGILNLEPMQKKITVSIHDQNGSELNSKVINMLHYQ
jgi:alkaline phosphatase D